MNNNKILEIEDAIRELCPTCGFSILNNDFNTIVWSENNTLPIPTLDQVNTKLNELKLLEPLKRLREERDKKLLQTDKYSITDWPHPTEEIRQAWITYRQQLRDLPTNTDSIKDISLNDQNELIGVVWPTPPQ